MANQVENAAEAVFGSGTRAKVLGYLAQASVPETGYGIAKALDLAIGNVYKELESLEEWAIVGSELDFKGGKRYRLIEEALRPFLLKRLRILPSDDWFSADRVARRRGRLKEIRALEVKVPRTRTARADRPFRGELQRSPGKDRELKRIGVLGSP
jgi:DNA-binding PadR family transcriptional regulator